jgi:hypothetical protein
LDKFPERVSGTFNHVNSYICIAWIPTYNIHLNFTWSICAWLNTQNKKGRFLLVLAFFLSLAKALISFYSSCHFHMGSQTVKLITLFLLGLNILKDKCTEGVNKVEVCHRWQSHLLDRLSCISCILNTTTFFLRQSEYLYSNPHALTL